MDGPSCREIKWVALDYDGTIATRGVVGAETCVALERYRERGGRLLLVTGRERPELEHVCQRLDLFELIVAENGGILFRPGERGEKLLGEETPSSFVGLLRARGVAPLSAGRVVIAMLAKHQEIAQAALREARISRNMIRNKHSLMLLPEGVSKATGLEHALGHLGVPWDEVAGAGDAENDVDFLQRCGHSVAVANALPEVRAIARTVTQQASGEGVAEFLAGLESMAEPGGPRPERL